jgi:hypothetical protein
MAAKPSDLKILPGPRMKIALAVAVVADILQMIVFPLVVEGAASPTDDVIDLTVAGIMGLLLGWHWEFLPSFAGKLVPGLDLVPLWTLAVANVYRKSKAMAAAAAEGRIADATATDRRKP